MDSYAESRRDVIELLSVYFLCDARVSLIDDNFLPASWSSENTLPLLNHLCHTSEALFTVNILWGASLHLSLNFLTGLYLAQKKTPVLKSDFSAVHKNVFSLLFISKTPTKVQMSLCVLT